MTSNDSRRLAAEGTRESPPSHHLTASPTCRHGHLFDDHADPLMEALAARRGQIGVPNVCPNPVVSLPETRISAGGDRR